MNTLSNYFYLVNSKHVLGWCPNSDIAMDLIHEEYPFMSPQEEQACTYVVKIAFKYAHTPEGKEAIRRIVMPSEDGGIQVEDGRRDNPEGTLAAMSPMMYKGLSANLATLYIGNEECHLVRRSDDQALSEDSYLALLRADYDSIICGAPGIMRKNYPCKIRTANDAPQVYKVEYPDGHDETIPEISVEAIALLGISLSELNEEYIELIHRVREASVMGVATYPSTAVWRHQGSHNFHIGKYPITYHRGEKTHDYCGMFYSGIVSGRRGGIASFIVGDEKYIIKSVNA